MKIEAMSRKDLPHTEQKKKYERCKPANVMISRTKSGFGFSGYMNRNDH